MAETGGLFVINAETGDESEFDSVTENGSWTFEASRDAEAHGTYGFKVTADGVDTGGAYGVKAFTEVDGDLWVRIYLYVDSGLTLDGTYQGVWTLQIFDGGTLLGRFGIRSAGTTTPSQWRGSWQYAEYGDDTNFSLDEFHYLEAHFVQDASVGGTELYVDGDLIASDVNQDTSAYNPDSIRVGLIGRACNSGHFVYIDDIKADTSIAVTGLAQVAFSYKAAGLAFSSLKAGFAFSPKKAGVAFTEE